MVVFPGPTYLDASALVHLYVPEQQNLLLDREIQGRDDLCVSDLGVTETVSAVSRLRSEGRASTEAITSIHNRLLFQIKHAFFDKIRLSAEICRSAEKRLIASSGTPLRAADALHLELAIAGGCRTIVTFDRRLGEAATLFGLHVFPVTESPLQTP